MAIDEDRSALARTLQELMDRLCAPDLTVGEAKVLRSRITHLLDRTSEGEGTAAGVGTAMVGTAG